MAHRFTADFRAIRGSQEFEAREGDVVDGDVEEWLLELFPNVPMEPTDAAATKPRTVRRARGKRTTVETPAAEQTDPAPDGADGPAA